MDIHATDKNLIRNAKDDIRQFDQIYKKYVDAIYRYCYNRLGQNKDLAEDITSETFMKAIERFDSYTYQGKPIINWLYRISHNLIVDYFKSKQRVYFSLENLNLTPVDEEDDLIDELSKTELADELSKVIPELPESLQEIFTLRLSEEMTFKEISHIVGKTEAAVKMSYHRGIKAVQKLMAKHVTSSV